MNEIQKKRFMQILEREQLQDADVVFWTSRLQNVPTDTVDRILEFFEITSDNMPWLRAIQERKEVALSQGDQKAWEDIIKEEMEHFASIPASTK